MCYIIICAGVVKLADALDSKSCGVKSVSVRVRPPAPTSKNSPLQGLFFIRSHIAHRRRADAGANEKEAVRSTAVFASAERGHRALRDTTGIRPLFTQRFRPSAERGHRALRDTTGIRPLFTQRFRPSAERGHRAPRDTTGIPPYPALRRLHIAHRRRADAGANEKEAVRSTAVFASAERGHRAPRDTTGIRPYPAMPDRNNINEIRKRSNISYFSNLTYL